MATVSIKGLSSSCVYRCLHGLAPSYFTDDIQLAAVVDWRRRCLSKPTLVIPATHLVTAADDRAFHVVTGRAWNNLPGHHYHY